MKNKLTLLLLCLALTIAGCSKDGAVGPQGPQGEKGDQGIPGKDGSSVLSGRGVPAASLGKDGDFYIDLQAGILYGPKASNAWSNSFSMVGKDGEKGQDGADGENGQDGTDGKDGANGKDGATMISGPMSPSLDDGNVGDFYFETTNALMYGPKLVNTWGTPVGLRTSSGTGVKAYVFKGIQPLEAPSNDYSQTRPFFYFRHGVSLRGVDFNKGLTFFYWNTAFDGESSGINEDNFHQYTWYESDPEGIMMYYTDQETNSNFSFRLDVTGGSYLTAMLIGEARAQSGIAASPEAVHKFVSQAKFNVLAKHIPYTSVEFMKSQNIDLENVDEVKRFLRMK